jgi:glycosyltransferase involved in cell wall biosynthesis
MRIIHWYSNFLAGGAIAETVFGLANAQIERGHDVLVVSRDYENRSGYNARLRSDLAAGLCTWVPTMTLNLGKLPARLVPRRTRAVLRRYNADILHIHNGIASEDVIARHVLPRTPAVLTAHGAFYPQVLKRKLRAYVELLKPFFYNRLSAFHAVSPAEAGIMGQIFRQQVYVVPNGLSAELSAGAATNAHRSDRPPGAIKLICIGRLDIQTKGLDILIAAFERAAVRSPQRLELVLVGPRSGPDYAAIVSLIERLGITDRVLITGITDRQGVGQYLRGADVFVQTSRWDACSLASVEAIAYGLPCILSSQSGVSTYPNIASLPHIRVIEPRVEEVTAAILAVVSSLEEQRESAIRCGPASREFFSWRRVADTHARTYARLIAT